MATQFEYKLVEWIAEVRSDPLNLDSLAIDRKLSEQRQEGWELASTGVSITHARMNYCTLHITYALKRPVAPTPVDKKERLHALLRNFPKRP
jgi:hypothetical protein